MLDVAAAPAEPAAPAPAADPVQTPDPGASAQLPADPTDGAAELLFDGKPSTPMVDDLKPEEKPAEPKADDKPKEETPEEKAAREAAETPEQKAAREAKEKEDAEKAKGASEAYEDFKLPEGVTIDAEVDKAFRDTAKELNLTQEQAQSLIDLQLKANAKQVEAASAAMQAQQDEWQEAMKSDKEFGGDKLNASLSLANKAVKQFGDPELTSLLAGPLGDNPALVRAFARVGKAVSEAPVIHGNKAQNADAASVLYPTMNK